ncbi:MAG: cupin domain-containing protein, partial [Candidatus Omnitrophica bacterium]|nr:cupin domain-containing protein [Candidatus Omnitrophota bacterium]
TAPYDALVNVLDGEAEILISGKPHRMKAGDAIIMPAGKPHALRAVSKFKMMLVMIKA